jgi:hypothetical protein
LNADNYRNNVVEYCGSHPDLFDSYEKHINEVRKIFARDLFESISKSLADASEIDIPLVRHANYIELYSKQLQQFIYARWLYKRTK